MVNVIVTHTVKNFDTWKPYFDNHAKFRKENGEISHTLYRGVEDRNLVVIEFEWESLEKAKAFSTSDDLRKKMVEAGVLGPPEIRILEKVAKKTSAKLAA